MNETTADGAIDSIEDLLRFPAPSPTGTCDRCGEALFRQGESRCYTCAQREAERGRLVREAMIAARRTIPAGFRFTSAGLDDSKVVAAVKDPTALDRVRKAAPESWILLRGSTGVGKSTIAAALAWERARSGVAPVWIDAIEAASCVARASLGAVPAIVRDARSAELLVIDDLASEPNVTTSPLAEIIHHRHAHGRTTIVTTWADIAKLRERYGDGVVRRLHEGATVIDMVPRRGSRA